MKRIFIVYALLCSFFLAAHAQSYQMVVKLNNGSSVKFNTDSVNEVVFAEIVKPTLEWALPSTNFGATASEVLSGVEEDTTTRTANVTVQAGSRTINYTYYFDADKKYQYALLTLADGDQYADYIKFLESEDFSADVDWASTADSVYRNEARGLIAFVTNEDVEESGDYARIPTSIVIAPLDESLYSWSRTDILKGSADAWMPLLGKGSTIDLMNRFEARLGHTVNQSTSAPQRGVYRFSTGDSRWNEVRYWFDVDTKQFLEEAAIYCDSTQRPTPTEVDEFLTTNGFEVTQLSDGESDLIYYDKANKVAAFVAMSIPSADSANFVPNIHFAFMDLSSQLPADSVDFPWPVTEYGVYTLDEVINKFKEMPYYQSDTTSSLGEGFYEIHTTSPDFPIIILMMNGDTYGACLVGTYEETKINSPYIPKLLTQKGYEYYEGPAFPTYVNWEENKETQIMNTDIFGLGLYFVAFEPNERTKE
ncbi:MAG: hypothetical protein ACOYJG_09645 [Prevotella sp.]|jgi:hypothetical protein